MSEIMKGNFSTKRPIEARVDDPTLEQQFEREALKRLGGSIAFVSKKRLLWNGDDDSGTGPTK
jgi:hypothetical protein